MKRLLSIFALLGTTLAASASDPAALCDAARILYDKGQYAAAATNYTAVLRAYAGSPAVFFNLGNAWLKQGRPGQAVLNYRRAARLAPRDGDIQANLRFTLQQAGVEPPRPPVVIDLLRHVSRKEWLLLGAGALWVGGALLIFALWKPGGPPAVRRTAAACGLLLTLALAGIGAWLDTDLRREAVVIAGPQKALFAPLEDATVRFALPEGALISIEERANGWVRARYGQQDGWLRESACTAVDAGSI